jgi:hypothetical protein
VLAKASARDALVEVNEADQERRGPSAILSSVGQLGEMFPAFRRAIAD